MRSIKLLFICAIFLLQGAGYCLGQSAEPESDCSGTAISSNANINSGQTFSGCKPASDNQTVSNLNLSGGTLMVCGKLTVSGMTLNSGKIIIECGGELIISSSILLNSNVYITNYGKITVNGSVEYQNSNNYIFNNHQNSYLKVTGNIIFPQNSSQPAYLINKGYVDCGGTFQMRDGAIVQMKEKSILLTNNFTNGSNSNNQVSYTGAADQTALIKYSGTFTMNNGKNLTTSSEIFLCKQGASSAPSNKGNATWSNSCTVSTPGTRSCVTCAGTTLPVELISFSGEYKGGSIIFKWTTASELNNSHFILERSVDADNFTAIEKVQGSGTTSVIHEYSATDNNARAGINYYRLKNVDTDGTFHLSDILAINKKNNSVDIYPNPATDKLNLISDETESDSLSIQISSLSGNKIKWIKYHNPGSGAFEFSVSDLPTGIYMLNIYDSRMNVVDRKRFFKK